MWVPLLYLEFQAHIRFEANETEIFRFFFSLQANIKEYGTYESYDYDDFM